MRLDSKAMSKIRYLEHKYGQLSNVPSSHPYINKLSMYGKNTPAPILDTLITFYLSSNELIKLNSVVEDLGKMRAATIRKWIIEYIKKPKDINTKLSIPKEERMSIAVYRKDFEKIVNLANEQELVFNELVAIIIKTKIMLIEQEN